MGRAPRTPDRLTGRPRPLRWAAIVVVAALIVAALAALDVIGGLAPPSPGPPTAAAATQPGPTGTARPSSAAPSVPALDPESGLRTIRAAVLPKAARATLDLISVGGPFPYAEDGSTFHNLERRLPAHADGYYREYTVEMPGSPDRGARRIVAGARGERYWTDDHYDTFWRIVP
jgi:ribonuclease T1